MRTTKNRVKAICILAMMFLVTFSFAYRVKAKPEYLRKAAKFGARECLFCHIKPQGGKGWNKRGSWLLKEKERRDADAIDVDWLKDYPEEGDEKVPSK